MPQPPFTDPDFIHQNRLPSNAVGFGYDTVGDARDSVVSPHYLCLDGEWDFFFYPTIKMMPDGIELIKDFSVSEKILVPSDRIALGRLSDEAQIINNPFPRIEQENSVCVYHRTIDVTTTMMERELFLRFDGIGACAEIFFNGSSVGFCQSSYDGHRFSIADFAMIGENHLTVIVYRFSYASCFEDSDLPRLFGIFRSVWLCGEPIFRLENYCLTTELTESGGRLFVDAEIIASAELEAMELWGLLYNTSGVIVGKGQDTMLSIVRTVETLKLRFEIELSDVHLWSDETPYLYRLVLYLQDTSGNTLDLRSASVGFREITIKKTPQGASQLLLNRNAVKMRGINYTEWDSINGRNSNQESITKTISLLKRCNINAIWLTQPACDLFYDLCDRLGMLVVSQMSVCPDIKAFTSDQLSGFCHDRLLSMYCRLKNHPSIVAWALGDNPPRISSSLYQLMKKLDDTRPIEGETLSCYEANNIKALNKLEKTHATPIILQNIGGRTTNGLSRIKKYVDALREQDSFAGIFICNCVELAFFDGETHHVFGEGGILRHDLTPYPTAFEVKQCYSPVAIALDGSKVSVYNNFASQALQDFQIGWELRLDGLARQSETVSLPAIKLGESHTFDISYNSVSTDKATDLVVNVIDARRYDWSESHRNVCFTYTRLKPRSDLPPCGIVVPHELDDCFLLERGGLRYKIDKQSGFLTAIEYDGFEFLSSPIRPQLSRVANDNDLCTELSDRIKKVLRVGFWRVAEQSVTLKNITTLGNRISAQFAADGIRRLSIDYSCTHEGELQIDFSAQSAYDVQRLGLTFETTPILSDLATFALGPGENYIDRKEAAIPVLVHGEANELCVDYSRPQDNANRHATEWLMLVGNHNQNAMMMLIRSGNRPFDMSVHPYTKKSLEEATPQAPPIGDRMTVNLDAVNSGIGEPLSPAIYLKNPNLAKADSYNLSINMKITKK